MTCDPVGQAVGGEVVRIELADEGGRHRHGSHIIRRGKEHDLGGHFLVLALVKDGRFLRRDQPAAQPHNLAELIDDQVMPDKIFKIARGQNPSVAGPP